MVMRQTLQNEGMLKKPIILNSSQETLDIFGSDRKSGVPFVVSCGVMSTMSTVSTVSSGPELSPLGPRKWTSTTSLRADDPSQNAEVLRRPGALKGAKKGVSNMVLPCFA